MPADIKADETMLTLENKLEFQSSDKINVAAQGKLTNLNYKDSVVLIKDDATIAGFDTSMLDKTLKAR